MGSCIWEASSDPRAGIVVFALDALDECKTEDIQTLVMMMDKFNDQTRESGMIKFLFTSRPYWEIMTWFNKLVAFSPYVHIPGEDHSKEIGEEVNLVISHEVNELVRTKVLSLENKMNIAINIDQSVIFD